MLSSLLDRPEDYYQQPQTAVSLSIGEALFPLYLLGTRPASVDFEPPFVPTRPHHRTTKVNIVRVGALRAFFFCTNGSFRPVRLRFSEPDKTRFFLCAPPLCASFSLHGPRVPKTPFGEF